jgi:tRNA threonylcarbamoyladenosine biosynthesis protein TsaB
MTDPLHLALDSSTSRPAVALLQGERCLHDWLGPEDMRHHETLLAGVHECLGKTGFRLSDLAFLSVGVGPGMFTGLRIGLTTAKFLADPLQLPCVPVSSLVALARQSGRLESRTVWAVSDAKAKRVYALKLVPGALSPDGSAPEGEEVALPPEQVALLVAPGDYLLGEGAALYRSLWPQGAEVACGEENFLRASAIGALGALRYRLGLTCSANQLSPKYLKTGQTHL